MSFKVTIEVPDSKLVSLLKGIPSGLTYAVSHTAENGAAKKVIKVVKRMNDDTVLTLGDIEKASEGTLAHDMCVLIQKHEKKHGIGKGMTRGELVGSMEEYSDAPEAAIKAAINRGIINRE